MTGLLLAAVLLATPAAGAPAGTMPDQHVTPGLVRALDLHTICTTRWGRDHRHITLKMKQDVARAYGVPWSKHRQYEFDHLVPRELGGADDELNLWPEPLTGPMNAHDKDRLENYLHKAVCHADLSLTDARNELLIDWQAAFRKYIK